jgi:hypothetical protein
MFGDTGFRSSIISLNSKSEICISQLTFVLQMGKRLARIHQSKVALIDWFISQLYFLFNLGD